MEPGAHSPEGELDVVPSRENRRELVVGRTFEILTAIPAEPRIVGEITSNGGNG